MCTTIKVTPESNCVHPSIAVSLFFVQSNLGSQFIFYFYIVYYKQTRNITPPVSLFPSVLAGSSQCLDQQIEENEKKKKLS